MNVDKNGNVWPDNDNSDAYDVRGDPTAMGDAGVRTGMDPGAPVYLGGMSLDSDATNAMGGIGADTKSDPMFDRFKMEGEQPNRVVESAAVADNVPGSPLVDGGAKSDPEFERYPNSSAVID